MREVARLLKACRGAALFIDYGYEGPAAGDTLQAVREHKFVSPLDYIGAADLTAHVDFAALQKAAGEEGVSIRGPAGQGDFLRRLGIIERADVLLKGAQDSKQRNAVVAALTRLTVPEQMGRLFQAVALCHDDSLRPEGF